MKRYCIYSGQWTRQRLGSPHDQTGGGFFYVPGASGHRLMLPTKYMEELKNAPEEKADFAASFAEV